MNIPAINLMKTHLNPFRFAELDTCYMVTVVINNASSLTNINNNDGNNNVDIMNNSTSPSNDSVVMPMICPTKMRVYISFKSFPQCRGK